MNDWKGEEIPTFLKINELHMIYITFTHAENASERYKVIKSWKIQYIHVEKQEVEIEVSEVDLEQP